MLGVNESGLSADFLCLCNGMEGQGSLTGGLRSIDFNDAPTGVTADTSGGVQCHRTRGDGLHLHGLAVTEAHNGAFAVLSLNLGNGSVQCLFLLVSQ